MTHAAPRVSRHRLLVVLSVAVLAFVLAQTMIIPALPAIGVRYGVSSIATTWLVTGFLLSAGVSAPLAGRFGDMFGKPQALLVVLVLFSVGLLGAALAPSFEVLVAARIVQGAGSAVLPLALGIVSDEVEPSRVPQSVGVLSAMLGFGSAFGVVLAGVYVDFLSVDLVFWTGALLTLVAALAGRRFIPRGTPAPARIDWLGALLLPAAMTCLLLAVSQGSGRGWLSAEVLVLAAASAVLFALFVVSCLRRRDPFINVRLMAERAVWSINLAAAGVGFALFGSLVLIPQLVQLPASTGYGFGAGASVSALVMLPNSVLALLGAALSGWLAARVSPRLPLAFGGLAAAAAYLLLAFRHGSLLDLALGGALSGLSVGMAIAALGNLALRAAPLGQTGVVTGINTVSRTVGGAVGAQVTAALLGATVMSSTGLPSDSGFRSAFFTAGIAALLALSSVLLIPGRRAGVTAPTGGQARVTLR